MKIEIETRFLNIDKKSLIGKLQELGAKDYGERMLKDIIFDDKDLKSLENDTLVRLRKDGDKITLTHKSNPKNSIDTAKEIEFAVSDFDDAKLFMEAVGMIAWRIVEKYRHTFTLDGATLDIDTWPKIPPYVELEGDSIEELRALASKLGFDWDKRFDKNPRYVFGEYGIDFDNIRTVTFDKFE